MVTFPFFQMCECPLPLPFSRLFSDCFECTRQLKTSDAEIGIATQKMLPVPSPARKEENTN